jgi:hypothetical protein
MPMLQPLLARMLAKRFHGYHARLKALVEAA